MPAVGRKRPLAVHNEIPLTREPSISLPDYWTAGKSTVAIVDPEYFNTSSSQDITQWAYWRIAWTSPGLASGISACSANSAFDYCVWRLGDLNLIFPMLFNLNCSAWMSSTGNDPSTHCRFGYHIFGIDETQQEVTALDFTGVLQEVIDVVSTSNDTLTGGATIGDVTTIFEGVIGVPIGGMDFNELIASDPELADSDAQLSYELLLVISRVLKALDASARTDNDYVYLTGHRVLWMGPIHTAIEYSFPFASSIRRTISAGPAGVMPKLVSSLDRPSDLDNIKLGSISSSSYPVASDLVLEMVDKQQNYCNDLSYKLFPESGNDRYNSNGFVAGLIDVASGVSSTSLDAYVGGDKPVPAGEFSGGSCN